MVNYMINYVNLVHSEKMYSDGKHKAVIYGLTNYTV